MYVFKCDILLLRKTHKGKEGTVNHKNIPPFLCEII